MKRSTCTVNVLRLWSQHQQFLTSFPNLDPRRRQPVETVDPRIDRRFQRAYVGGETRWE